MPQAFSYSGKISEQMLRQYCGRVRALDLKGVQWTSLTAQENVIRIPEAEAKRLPTHRTTGEKIIPMDGRQQYYEREGLAVTPFVTHEFSHVHEPHEYRDLPWMTIEDVIPGRFWAILWRGEGPEQAIVEPSLFCSRASAEAWVMKHCIPEACLENDCLIFFTEEKEGKIILYCKDKGHRMLAKDTVFTWEIERVDVYDGV